MTETFQCAMSRCARVLLMIVALRTTGQVHAADCSVTIEQQADRLEISIDGAPFATYVFNDPVITRPYFMNVKAPGGVQVTRNQPPVAGVDLMDHPTFHPGIWLAFGDISGADTWRLKSPVKLDDITVFPSNSEGYGAFTAKYRYYPDATADDAVCAETTDCKIYAVDAGSLLVWDTEFTSKGEAVFGDQEEMGLGIRVATAIRAQRQPDGAIPGGNGTILDSAGRKNEKEVWGKTADWCDYSGIIDGQRVGMTIFCHPDNFRPSWFHARDRGLLEANLFGQQAFTDGGPSKVVVNSHERLRLRYGILVHANAADDAGPDLEAAYQQYLELARK